MNTRKTFLIVISIPLSLAGAQQTQENSDKFLTWLPYQVIPNFTWTTFPSQTNFAFEWEATPLLYSFGMTKLISPWYALIVEPPARFTGSVEFNISGVAYTSKPGSSHFGYSAQLLGHLPLIERGEHLALNVGVAKYMVADASPTFIVGGFSTLFGLVHFNLKYSSDPQIWISAIELRIF